MSATHYEQFVLQDRGTQQTRQGNADGTTPAAAWLVQTHDIGGRMLRRRLCQPTHLAAAPRHHPASPSSPDRYLDSSLPWGPTQLISSRESSSGPPQPPPAALGDCTLPDGRPAHCPPPKGWSSITTFAGEGAGQAGQVCGRVSHTWCRGVGPLCCPSLVEPPRAADPATSLPVGRWRCSERGAAVGAVPALP